ncbi:MAG: ketoacyl-ACP synthase III [Rickettsiales bacterium]|nr:ketoacyl-ACP synthase III [Rickettsiales bacterium]
MSISAIITATGSYLPEQLVTNADLEKQMETSDEWIRTRTGIHQRHIAKDGETTSDLAAKAAKAAIDKAGLKPDDIDMIIVATGSPDYSMPSTGVLVQQKLGMTRGFAFDISAACSGFVYGLGVVKSLIESGQINRAVLIGAETMSRLVNWEDRSTCVLFGDGAGAVVIESKRDTDKGILGVTLASDGSEADILRTTGGVSSTKDAGYLQMEGKEVFRHGVEKMVSAAESLIDTHGYALSDIDWFVPHQANVRIIQSIAKKIKVASDKFLITLDQHANTSAASIPLALDVGVGDGRIKSGQLIATPALGAGLTWGCCIIKW